MLRMATGALCAVDRHMPDTGLGLTIASTIVSADGGEIAIDSTPARGGTFHVTPLHRLTGCGGRLGRRV